MNQKDKLSQFLGLDNLKPAVGGTTVTKAVIPEAVSPELIPAGH